MPPSRRVWCACVIIDYLKGVPRAQPDCDHIIDQAERGETELVVSALAFTEVINLGSIVTATDDATIREFFGRRYVIIAAVDLGVADRARTLRRTYASLKTVDAIHMATALYYQIEILETYDEDLLKLDRREGASPLIIRKPTYEGQGNFLATTLPNS